MVDSQVFQKTICGSPQAEYWTVLCCISVFPVKKRLIHYVAGPISLSPPSPPFLSLPLPLPVVTCSERQGLHPGLPLPHINYTCNIEQAFSEAA